MEHADLVVLNDSAQLWRQVLGLAAGERFLGILLLCWPQPLQAAEHTALSGTVGLLCLHRPWTFALHTQHIDNGWISPNAGGIHTLFR